MSQSPSRRFSRRHGLSLIEMIISLAISAMLLTAVAAAFVSSSGTIENNDQFFRASHAARVAMEHILTDVRRSHAVEVASQRLDLIAADMADRGYRFDRYANTLYLVDNVTGAEYPISSNVSVCAFACDTMTDAGGISHVVRVSLVLEIQVDNNRVRLSGSAAPRRERAYE